MADIPERPDDIELLAAYDFAGRNEAEIRGDWIEPLLRQLGYGLGTRHEILRERQLTLEPPTRRIGSTRIRIDFVPTVFGHRLWIIEAKRPEEGEDLFSEEHLGQAWSYATDPRIDVPFIVLCDGSRLGIFDLTQAEWSTPLFDHPKEELVEHFDQLLELVGARQIAETIRQRQLRHLRSALETQIDLDVLDRTSEDVKTMVEEVRPIVDERRREIRDEARAKIDGSNIDTAGVWGYAAAMNRPLNPVWSEVERCAGIVRSRDALVKEREFGYFEAAVTLRDEIRPRMWFTLRLARFGCALLLAEDEDCGEVFRAAAREAAAEHANALAGDPVEAAAYRLQRALGPLGWRLAALAKPTIDSSAQKLEERLDAEDWLKLDGEWGITGLDTYKRAAIIGPQAALSQVSPWELDPIIKAADEAEETLARVPITPGMEGMTPAGDPWLRSWQEGDPLKSSSAWILRELAARGDSPGVAELAEELLQTHYRAKAVARRAQVQSGDS